MTLNIREMLLRWDMFGCLADGFCNSGTLLFPRYPPLHMHQISHGFAYAYGKFRKTLVFLIIVGLIFNAAACSGPLVHPDGAAETGRIPSSIPAVTPAATTAPIRFLLSFDDGPAASASGSPTSSILNDLADNPLQPGIKAIFFLQTRAADAGGSALGRELMQREHDAGHVLGFHTATAGHANHRYLEPAVFERSLNDGIEDIRRISGAPPVLVRPPFWSYDGRTFAAYQKHGLQILLTDLSANDGKIWGVNFSLRRRSSMLHQLAAVREQVAFGVLPVIDGNIPVIVTFHDINSYTARHLQEYLQILLDSAHELGMPTAAQPFYDDRAGLERAALGRAVSSAAQQVRLPGLWHWIWN
ncbi:MAG: polysaccharide deacetylase family protein [Pseudomonadota bacterium]